MTTKTAREAIAEETAKCVTFELAKADRTKKWLADRTGIPYTTLDRKLKGLTELSFYDLALIANALRVKPSTFTPSVFRSERAA